jgi:hypothetical protein
MGKQHVTLLCLFSLIWNLRQAAHLQRQASSEASSLWSELLAKPASNVDLSCGFPQVSPLRDSFAHEILGRYRHSFGLTVSVDINVLRARAVDVDRLRQHTSSHRHGGVKPLEGDPSLCGSR